jgi:hypothetical protein
VETSLGVFTAMGGSATFSSAQPYLGIALGREADAGYSIAGGHAPHQIRILKDKNRGRARMRDGHGDGGGSRCT